MIMTYTIFFYDLLKIERVLPTQPQQNLNLAKHSNYDNDLYHVQHVQIMSNSKGTPSFYGDNLYHAKITLVLLKIERVVNDTISSSETC